MPWTSFLCYRRRLARIAVRRTLVLRHIFQAQSFYRLLDTTGTRHAIATSNYVGNNGSDTRSLATGARREFTARVNESGVFGYMFAENSYIRFGDVTDGLSNTILLGERAWEIPGPGGVVLPCDAGVVFGVKQQSANNNRLELGSFQPQVGNGRVEINSIAATIRNANCAIGFSSLHQGGAQFVLADGSVRFIIETIQHTPDNARSDDTVFENLLNRTDGNAVGQF